MLAACLCLQETSGNQVVQLLQPQDLGQLLISASPQHWVISCSLTGDLNACIASMVPSAAILQHVAHCMCGFCMQAGILLQHLLSHHHSMAPTERFAMVCYAYEALCIMWFTIIVVH